MTFDIKKYIRNGGNCDYIPRKNAFFQALLEILPNVIMPLWPKLAAHAEKVNILTCFKVLTVCMASEIKFELLVNHMLHLDVTLFSNTV